MYKYDTVQELLDICKGEQLPFWEVVLRAECDLTEVSREQVWQGIQSRLAVFAESVAAGFADKERTASGMSGGQADYLAKQEPRLLGALPFKAMTYALAVSEANAKMSKIVACPTAGSCGIAPGCILATEEVLALPKERAVEGLLAAAGIGKVVTQQATVAGAVGGCQAECGTAAAMAAAAVTQMLGGTPEQVAHAAALALKNVLGLVCDPVAGLVEVPCVKRNGIHAVHSLSAAEMALGGLESSIPVDEVIHTMGIIGKSMPRSLRETSEGGLACSKTGLAIAEKVKNL